MTAATKPLPPHGTTARSGKCDCPPCRKRRCAYKKAWRTAKHRGQVSPLTDSTPALDHIRDNLLPAAWTRRQIEYAAGISHDYVRVLLGQNPPQIHAETANAILALGPASRFRNVPDGAQLDPTGTRRRLQALAVKGHRLEELLKRLHCNNGVMGTEFVLAGTARRIAAEYDRLWRLEGPSRIGATRARNRGWVGPGAWDDWTIDDPRAVPNVGVEHRQWPAPLLLAEAAIAAHTTSDVQVIAARVGTTVAGLERAHERVKARAKAGAA